MLTFISYRRKDSEKATGAIYQRLADLLGRKSLFMDTTDIQGGADFSKTTREKLESCDSLLVIIGPGWATDPRLFDPTDYVRFEVSTALKGKTRVIPVLVDGAEIPSAGDLPEELQRLAGCQAVEVRFGRDFPIDIERLARLLGKVRRCLGVTRWLRRCARLSPGFYCDRHRYQAVIAPLLVAVLALFVIAATSPSWLFPTDKPKREFLPEPASAAVLAILVPAESARVGQEFDVEGRSAFLGRPHYLVVTSPQDHRYVVGRAFEPAEDSTWTAKARLGSGEQGRGEWFRLEVLVADTPLREGMIGVTPPRSHSSPAVPVFRSH